MRPHVSINVKDVTKSVEFYSLVFGIKPQKQTDTYAKFDLKEPALNFSMQSEYGKPSQVSHFGIEVDSADEVEKWEKILLAKGVLKEVEKDSTCCYARQDKVWFTDPDGNAWEIFYVYEQLPVEKKKESMSCCG